MRAKGFALPEVLVALAIGGLILSGLIYLNLNYVRLSRRVAEAVEHRSSGFRLMRASGLGEDRCRNDSTLEWNGEALDLIQEGRSATRILKRVVGKETSLFDATDRRVAGARGLVRVQASTALQSDGSKRTGWSTASLQADDETLAVFALRCDLPEICAYDSVSGECR